MKHFMFTFRELLGFLNLKHLTKKVGTQNYKLTDPIDKVVFKQFRRVTDTTILGLASRILEIDEFLAVTNSIGRLVGVVTHMQLLDFISRDEKSRANENVSNGVSA